MVQMALTVMLGWSMGTRNSVMPACLGASGSVRAPTQYHSAKWAEVVQVFWPLSIQPPSTLVALSCMLAASDPALGTHGGHEGPALWRVNDLGHVFPGQVEDIGVVIGVEEGLDLFDERQLLIGELELHGAVTSGTHRGAGSSDSTGRRPGPESDYPSD